MLNIIFAMLIVYGIFTILSCSINLILHKIFNQTVLTYMKVVQISNVGLGASLMVTFLAMMFIPQLNISPEEKTLYLFITFVTAYFFIIAFSFYSHLSFKDKQLDDNKTIDEHESQADNEQK